MQLPREFALIERHFRPLAAPAARSLADDAAVLDVPVGRQLVVSTDAMVEGVHWLAGTDPSLVARKLLRVNLSDLAAMGATPLGYLLTVAVCRETDDAWFAAVADGLAQDQAAYKLALLGGDSTAITGPACLSITILGTVPAGQAIGRAGARRDDEVWVSGMLGAGALGLAAARGQIADPDGSLVGRYHLPQPRLGLADGIAAAAIDVSDGLLQELGHLCRGAGLAVEIDTAAIPLPPAAAGDWHGMALRGGDDYELLMAVRPADAAALQRRAASLGVAVSRIGRFVAGPPAVRLDGAAVVAEGWSHFTPLGPDSLTQRTHA